MDITQSERGRELAGRIQSFMAEHIYPNERRFYQEAERLGPWAVHPGRRGAQAARTRSGSVEPFPAGARAAASPISNMRPCARSWAARIWPRKCSTAAPRHRQHGDDPALRDEAQKEHWLKPLLAGRNPIRLRDDRAGCRLLRCDQYRRVRSSGRRRYVINGRKWYTTGATDPRCKIIIFMGQTDPQMRIVTGANR